MASRSVPVRPRPARRALTRLAMVAALVASQIAPGGVGRAQQAPSGGASPAAVDEGLYYHADGQRIGLLRRTDQIAVAYKGDDAGLTKDGAPLAGFTTGKAVTTGVQVFRDPEASADVTAAGLARNAAKMQDAIAAAEASPDVEWAVPVYVDAVAGGTLVATNEVIVALDRPANPAAFFGGDARVAGYRPLLGTDDQFVATLADGAGEAAIQLANALHEAPGVAWAAPNFYRDLKKHALPNDPLLPTAQWHLQNTGQTGGLVDADVDAPEAWDFTTGSPNVVVAVIDDGMEYTHPDLAANVWVNAGEIPGNGIDDDGNGWVDDVRGWDFTSAGIGDNDPGPSTIQDAHATSVAGIIAAVGNNGLGVAGVAYNSKVMAVRIFLGGAFAGDAQAASAIYYAAGRTANGLGTWNAAHILNNSWGGGSPSTPITAAFTWASTNGRGGKGVLSFISSGNSGAGAIAYPANLAGTLSGVAAVGASTHTDVRSSYSQFGPQLDFVAPSSGLSVGTATTDRVGANGYNPASTAGGGDYTTAVPETTGFGGTSSASPLAAGIGALLLSQDMTRTAVNIRDIMRATTDPIGPLPYVAGFNTQYGYGRVNAFKAVSFINLTGPEVAVFEPGGEVALGGVSGGYSALVGQAVTRTYSVRNVGPATLELGAIAVSPGAFSVQTPLSDTTLSLGESATFTIAFTAPAAGPAGGTVSFATNDADENPFTFSLQGTGVPVSISGYLFEDWDGDGVREANEPGLPGWAAFLDANDNGVLDRTSFATSPNTPIVDSGTITSTLAVSGLGTMRDVNVRVNLTHTFVSDLRLRLISPGGTAVTLISQRGGSGDNLVNTTFDDEASTPISGGAAPFTGTFRPETPLSALDGQDPNGTWTLEVADLAALDTGTLQNWTIGISDEADAVSDATGFYRFLSLPPGSYTVRRVLQAGWNATGPAGGAYTRVLDTIDSTFPDTNFGQVRQNAVYGQQFTDLAGNGVRDAGDPPAAGWTVGLDANNNGVLEPPLDFTASPNVAIPDNNVTGVSSTQTVSGAPTGILDVNVSLNITHTFVSDLEIRLTSPAGTIVPLILRRGSNGDNFTNTVLDDQAPVSIASIVAAGAPFTGRFRPESPLSALNGQDANGTWTLRVADRAGADLGTLLNWTLSFERDPTVVTPASGNFVFTGLAPGAYRLLQLDQAGYTRTLPTAGSYPLAMNANDSLVGYDFGNVVAGAPRIVGQVVAKGANASTVTVRFTNAGTGPAVNALVDTVSFRTLAGTGSVTLTGPALPVALGSLPAGAWVERVFTLNVPAAVTRFVITEGGSYQSAGGTALRFSSSQAVTK